MKQPIPIHLLHSMNLDSLRVWVCLKQLYRRNTVIYNFSYKTLSNQTGISHTTLRKHIPILIENNLAQITNGHLHLTGINKLKKHSKETCVLIPVEKSKSKQILQFRKAILHRNIDNQKKQIKQKSEIVKNCKRTFGKLSKSAMKKINKAGGTANFEKTLQPVTTLSNKSIGNLFGLSQISGHRIQKKLRDANLIKTKVRLELFKKNCSPFEYNYLKRDKGYIYNTNTNILYIRLSNQIEMQ